MFTWPESSGIRTGHPQSSYSLCHPRGPSTQKAQRPPRARVWRPAGAGCLACASKADRSICGKPPNIHPGTFSRKNPHPVLIVSRSLKLLIYFFPPREINRVPDGNEIEN